VEVLREIAGGNRNRDIAEKLFITEETVKVHIKHIMEKLGASDRTQAVAIGVRRGIIQL
jgi:DNA-binding NarL/FixJ family response regulator